MTSPAHPEGDRMTTAEHPARDAQDGLSGPRRVRTGSGATIAQSELERLAELFDYTEGTVAVALAAVLTELGIEVVPDPIPEPEGDVLAVDARGSVWRRDDDDLWSRGNGGAPWAYVVENFVPVKVYRLEEGQ